LIDIPIKKVDTDYSHEPSVSGLKNEKNVWAFEDSNLYLHAIQVAEESGTEKPEKTWGAITQIPHAIKSIIKE